MNKADFKGILATTKAKFNPNALEKGTIAFVDEGEVPFTQELKDAYDKNLLGGGVQFKLNRIVDTELFSFMGDFTPELEFNKHYYVEIVDMSMFAHPVFGHIITLTEESEEYIFTLHYRGIINWADAELVLQLNPWYWEFNNLVGDSGHLVCRLRIYEIGA